jgi:hypothetical protein
MVKVMLMLMDQYSVRTRDYPGKCSLGYMFPGKIHGVLRVMDRQSNVNLFAGEDASHMRKTWCIWFKVWLKAGLSD